MQYVWVNRTITKWLCTKIVTDTFTSLQAYKKDVVKTLLIYTTSSHSLAISNGLVEMKPRNSNAKTGIDIARNERTNDRRVFEYRLAGLASFSSSLYKTAQSQNQQYSSNQRANVYQCCAPNPSGYLFVHIYVESARIISPPDEIVIIRIFIPTSNYSR